MASAKSHPMIGGDDEYSYAKNSNVQKDLIARTKLQLVTAIDNGLELCSSVGPFCVADLGCSIGPNTFIAINDILEAIKQKFQTKGRIPEFQVFFNDHTTNDFNALFINLPSDREYFVCAVPGSFHGRLFPEKSLDFVYTSNSLHWISSIPKELKNLDSPVFNKGKIHLKNAPRYVGDAYKKQFAKDFESFLSARSLEMVPKGLMMLNFLGRPNGTNTTTTTIGALFLPVESCLGEMADEGYLSKIKIDSFNIPIYEPTPDELTLIIEENGCFDIKQIETSLLETMPYLTMPQARSATEKLFTSHFGKDIIDELFDRYAKRIDGLPHLTTTDDIGCLLFVVLQRKSI